jgi:hypothetical protein
MISTDLSIDDILDELQDLPVGETISDAAAGFIIWWLDQVDQVPNRPRDDYDNLLADHLLDYYAKNQGIKPGS